jgi:protein-S-isoprenylcysteine O-methyltransferase Ste14
MRADVFEQICFEGKRMDDFTWLVDATVILGVAYLSFAMALAGWFAGLRRGEAVTLLPERGSGPSKFWVQIAIALFSLVLCAALIYMLWIPLPLSLSGQFSANLRILGFVLFIAGTFLVLWARRTLGRMWGISTSRKVFLLPDHQLIMSGPYKVIRHPMYLGWWLAVLGMVLIYRTWVLVAVLIFSIVVFARRARLEEKVLSEKFGGDWEDYARSTKSLIPAIY